MGLPIGPYVGSPEPISEVDAVAAVFELALIMALLGMGSSSVRRGLDRLTPTLGGAAVLAVALTSTLALATEASGGHPHDEADVAHQAPAESHDQPVVATSPATASSIPSAVPPAPSVAPPPTFAASSGSSTPAKLVFGTRLDAGGRIYEAATSFTLGQVVVWTAALAAPLGTDEVRFQVIEPKPSGEPFVHWDQPFRPGAPTSRTLVGAADLALYAHDGVGTYVLRYVREAELLAEGTVTLTAP